MNIHVHHHLDLALERRLDLLLMTLIHNQEVIMAALDDLKANVAKNTDATAAAVTLLGNLKTALDAAIASGNMDQVQALSDAIGKNDDALAAAVTVNTPAAPTPPTPPSSAQ